MTLNQEDRPTEPPVRHGLSNSGIDPCPKCGSDLYYFKEGPICANSKCDYNVDWDEYERRVNGADAQ